MLRPSAQSHPKADCVSTLAVVHYYTIVFSGAKQLHLKQSIIYT